eukprot:TRINITY_DN21256_c0_g3_i1.p1 TRINITY_DN21256_c0_g3~~TRINITY_DN21256_c0_g3_i1.p1  ORF type:complete len:320 (-),score=60.13 TRINITY_DN21256_c0_g3_i1:89-1048(-)
MVRVQSSLIAPRCWDDESYASFYKASKEEQRLMLSPASRALTSAGARRLDAAWRRRGDFALGCEPRLPEAWRNPEGGALLEHRLLQLQRSFAEFSGGRGCVPARAAPELLAAVGFRLPPAQVRELALAAADAGEAAASNAVSSPASPRTGVVLDYDAALRLFYLAMEAQEAGAVPMAVVGAALEGLLHEDLYDCRFAEQVLDPAEEIPASARLASPRSAAAGFGRSARTQPSPHGVGTAADAGDSTGEAQSALPPLGPTLFPAPLPRCADASDVAATCPQLRRPPAGLSQRTYIKGFVAAGLASRAAADEARRRWLTAT